MLDAYCIMSTTLDRGTTTERQEAATTKDEYKKGNGPAELNTPKLDEAGKPQRKAIENAEQAHGVAKGLEKSNGQRVEFSGIVERKYNGEQPFSQKKLVEAGQGWRNNFSTNPMASFIDPVIPQLTDAIHRLKYLTNSSLPDEIENADRKTMVFRERMTETIRNWPEWFDFLNTVAREDFVHGYCVVAQLDAPATGEWRLAFFRQDEAFVPEGTGQHPSKCQVIAFRKFYLIHEFIDLWGGDKDASEAEGYNIDNCIKAANEATSGGMKPDSTRDYADMVREGNLDSSYKDGAKTVDVYFTLVPEYSGKVALWMTNANNGDELRHVEEFTEDLKDCVMFFTLQSGNMKLFGSKGAGRFLVNLHIALDRSRNLGFDQQFLSGLVLAKVGKGRLNEVQIVVRHPFIFVEDDNFQIQTAGPQFDFAGFEGMDRAITGIAQSVVGAFVPKQMPLGGSSKTKIEAAGQFAREEAVKQGVVGRFYRQVMDLVGLIQTKLCSEVNIKEAYRIYQEQREKQATWSGKVVIVAQKIWDAIKRLGKKDEDPQGIYPIRKATLADQAAVNCILAMLNDGLTVSDIMILANQPAAETTEDTTAETNSSTQEWLAANAQNQFVDKKKATALSGEIAMGRSRIHEILIADEDPTVMAEAVRQQRMEFGSMLAGEDIPVSPRDNHAVHKRELAGHLGQLVDALKGGQPTHELVNGAKLAIKHFGLHSDESEKAGAPKGEIEGDRQFAQAIASQVAPIEQALQQQTANASGGIDMLGAQVSPLMAESQASGGKITGEDESRFRAAELDLKKKDSDRRDQETQLKIAGFKHKVAMDTVKTGSDMARIIHDQKTKDRAADNQTESFQ